MEIRSMFQPIVSRSLQYTHDRDHPASDPQNMPELPEVEVTRRGIAPFVAGRRVERVDVRTAMLRWPVPAGLAEQLRARAVLAVERRGKYLLFEVDAGWFIVHLGMTGTLRVLP